MIDPLDPKHFPSALFARLEEAVHCYETGDGDGWSEGRLGAFLRVWSDTLGLRPQPDPSRNAIDDARYEAAVAGPALAAEMAAMIADREADGAGPYSIERFGDLTSPTEEDIAAINRARAVEWAPVNAARFARQLDADGELPAAELARYLDGTAG